MTISSISSIQNAFNSTFTGTKTGTVTDTTQGSGTYADTVSHQDGVATFDDLTTYANGNTAETKTSITKNADGTFGETIQNYVDGNEVKSQSLTTSADGSSVDKTFQIYTAKGKVACSGSETITGNTDGSESITGSETWASGNLSQIAGTVSQSDSGVDQSISVTNWANQTSTRDWQNSRTGGTGTGSLAYTNFAGTSATDTTTKTQSDS